MEKEAEKLRINIDSEKAEKQLKALAGVAKSCQQAVQGTIKSVKNMGNSLLSLAQQGDESNVAVKAIQSSLQGLGTALAEAFQPVVTAAVPLLATLCDWLVTAANYIAMFFAVLGGGNSYKKAVAGQKSYNKSLKSGSGAAKKFVNNLSGLDEIHLWQEPTSGGSGGGGGNGGDALDGLKFEDVFFDADKIRELLNDILWYAGAIAAALLTWKIAQAFGADLSTALGLAMAVGSSVLFVKDYLDAWNNGIDFSNMKNLFLDIAGVILGLAIAFGPVGAAIGALVGGIALCVLALREWIQTGELSNEACAVLTTGILLIGGAIAVLTGSFIPLIIAAVAALAVFIAAHWDEIKAWTISIWTAIKDWCVETWESIKDKAVEIWQAVRDWVVEKVTDAKDKIVSAWNTAKTTVLNIWNDVRSKAVELWTSIKEKIVSAVSNAKESVVNKFNEIKTNIQEKVAAARESVAAVFESMRSDMQAKVNSAKERVTSVFDSIRSAMQEKMERARDKVKTVIDKIKSLFNFQWSLPALKTPHLSWSTTPASGWVASILSALGLPTSLPKLSVSWYAKGGIVDGATLIGAGEAGREAIIPLERHTEWIDAVAERIAQLLGTGKLADGLSEIADRLGDIPGALERLGMAMTNIPTPVMATGGVIPPRAVYVDGPVQGLADAVTGLREALGLSGNGQGRTAQNSSYTFIAQMDRRTIFKEVIAEARLRQTQTGRNPFELA